MDQTSKLFNWKNSRSVVDRSHKVSLIELVSDPPVPTFLTVTADDRSLRTLEMSGRNCWSRTATSCSQKRSSWSSAAHNLSHAVSGSSRDNSKYRRSDFRLSGASTWGFTCKGVCSATTGRRGWRTNGYAVGSYGMTARRISSERPAKTNACCARSCNQKTLHGRA